MTLCLKINGKGYTRLSPDFSMDFVRLIYFVVFLMLDKMKKKENRLFKLAWKRFSDRLSPTKILAKTVFFVLKSLTVTIRAGHFLAKGKNFTCNVFTNFHAFFLVVWWLLRMSHLTIKGPEDICVGKPKKTSEKRNQFIFCDLINDVSLMNHTSSECPWS